jgi:predicted RNA-binding Zn ribbon-like protein
LSSSFASYDAPRPASDESLELVRTFVNTLELDAPRDAIASPRELAAWLRDRGLLAPRARVTARDTARAREVREAIRALLRANNDLPADTVGAARVLEAAARRARFTLRFPGHGPPALAPTAGGVDGALGRLVAAVADAMQDRERWSRLKACRADDCQWAFVDRARNRSRRWCSMRVCGNREKARAFRSRHR